MAEWLAACHTASIPDLGSGWLTSFSTLRCTTQPLTNNLTRCGMWLNAEVEEEQVLMNHKQPQDCRAPAPRITVTIILIIIPPFALSFLRCLAVAKTTACYQRTDQHVLTKGLPRWIPITGFTFGWRATGVSIPVQGWKDSPGSEGRKRAQDFRDKDYLWTCEGHAHTHTHKKKKSPTISTPSS